MLGFNLVDLIILLLLGVALFSGKKLGLANQLLVVVGLFGALFFGGAVFPHLLPIHDRTIHTVINATLVLFAACCGALLGHKLAQRLHWQRLRRADAWFGMLIAAAACLVMVWLVATAFSRLPFAGLSNSVSDARIVQLLNRHLPSVPAVFAEFDRQVDPNAQPYIFVAAKPSANFSYSAADVQAAATAAANSVVRITSFGCGGLISGSGFVAAPGLVITNAHVIAGVQRPIVKYNNQSYEGVPVLFDANLDLAILRVPGLTAPALTLATQDLPVDTTVLALGYPGGNYTLSPGLIRDELSADGRNIYDEGVITRNIYEVQTTVDPGSSGGPLVLASGQVAGIIFSKSATATNDAFALTSTSLLPSLTRAQHSQTRVSTTTCLAD